MAWNIQKHKDICLSFFSRLGPKYGIKFDFSERKNMIIPKCPETSKEAKIFLPFFPEKIIMMDMVDGGFRV